VIANVDRTRGVAAARALTERGLTALFVPTDVREGAQVAAMVERTIAAFGGVDILVHGAGVGVHGEVVDQEWDLQIDVQLRGAFLLSRAAGRRMTAQRQGGADRLHRLDGGQQRPGAGRPAGRVEGRGDPARGAWRSSWDATGSR
jgi:NAD(P)-dependent dehydrogenase (short-subunit alcohol dehydrogenase family)